LIDISRYLTGLTAPFFLLQLLNLYLAHSSETEYF
jgi:hypothetical protein